MKSIVKFLSLLWFTLAVNSVFAATYYVSKTGNDNNNGSINAPFSTFNKAVSVMSAGDTCIIRGGIYEEELIVNKNGTAANLLTFKAADGEEVELKATSAINGWQPHSGSIYKTTVNMSIASRFRAVYHNGDYMDLARWPNNVDNNRWTIDCTPLNTSNGGDGSHFITQNDIPNIDWTGGIVYYLGAHSGTSWIRPITGSSTKRIDYVPVDPVNDWPFSNHSPLRFENGNRGQLFLFNKLEALDHPREWYFEEGSNTLYLQTENGSIPANDSVEYATRQFTAQLRGDYIRLEGIKFYGGAIKIHNNADNNQVINCTVIHGSEGHDSLTNSGAQVGEASIEALGDNTLIKGCIINHSSVNGIVIPGWAADSCIVEGNMISNTDYIGIHASPVRITADNSKVLKNTFFNTGRDGMYVAGDNCEVAYNDVSRSQIINDDSGVFYTVGNNDQKNTEIHHNWFHDALSPSYSNQKGAGIYLDNDSKGYTVHHNVVWNVTWTGYQVNWNNVNLDFYHNTIWNAKDAMDSWVNGRAQSNNKIYNNYANTGNWHAGNGPSEFDIKDSPIFSASPFEDADNQNFIPTAGSALVDAAPIIPGFDKAFEGSAADIGAYERGGVAWTAGINAIEDTTTPTATTPTITQTIITSAEVTTDASDSPTSWVTNPATLTVTVSGFTAQATTTVTFFNQIKNAAGVQFAGGQLDIDIDASGNGSRTFNAGFFGAGLLTSNQTVSWSTNVPGATTTQSFPVTLPTLSTIDFAKNDIANSISPNPVTNSILKVEVEEAETYTVYSLAGEVIISQAASGTIDFTGVSAGIYLLITEVGTAKVIVE